MYTDEGLDSAMATPVQIPEKILYKASEVCAIAKVQPYVLRSWEAEFPELGLKHEGSRSRVYRRVDLDKVLRIKDLLFVEGLTLGAARRKILKEIPLEKGIDVLSLEELVGADLNERLEGVKAGLRSILTMIGDSGDDEKELPSAPAVERNGVVSESGSVRAQRKPSRARRVSVKRKTKQG